MYIIDIIDRNEMVVHIKIDEYKMAQNKYYNLMCNKKNKRYDKKRKMLECTVISNRMKYPYEHCNNQQLM